MIKHSRLLDLDPGNQFFDGLRGVEAHPHGRVLMNNPTIDSTPGERRCRPDTVAPKTTSTVPVNAPSRDRPRALPIVLAVTPSRAARAVSAAVVSDDIDTFSFCDSAVNSCPPVT